MNFKTSALIAALTLSATASFAASDNNLQDDYLDAQAHAKALSAQLDTMGVDANATIDFNSPVTLSQKVEAYHDKISDLQGQFESARAAQ
ncbi:hypothetical protein [Marinomonas atlantica]|uniref:hypothetical protein n=1 Tax=Marinomonas atlantica TaxID=1806668 RepID=UPI0008330C06|nr:hypothetical protein [Marinomonas atlantica]